MFSCCLSRFSITWGNFVSFSSFLPFLRMIGGALKGFLFLAFSSFFSFLSLWSFVSLDGFYVGRCVDFPIGAFLFGCSPIFRWVLWWFSSVIVLGFLAHRLYDWVLFALVLLLCFLQCCCLVWGWFFCYVWGRFLEFSFFGSGGVFSIS